MKKLVFLLVMLAFFGCQKEETIYREKPISSGDGCNYLIYNYSGTPIAGDFEFAHSQVNYSKVESIVKPIHDNGDLEQLANDVVSPFTNPYERVYAIYYWIAENIRYDTAMYYSGEYNCDWQNSISVLNRKIGVCEGFANLFCALCKNVGITSTKISGLAVASHHAWNAVEIENKWYLLDVTWDRNEVKGNQYFIIDPQYFYYYHTPDDSKWKLF